MASAHTKVRFVKCPKCLRVLIEVPDVPVYKCGGCGTILRAKHHNDNGGNTSLGPPESSSSNPPDSGPLSNKLANSQEQMIPLPKVENGPEQARPPNILLSDLSAPHDSQRTLESSSHSETGIEESGALKSMAHSQLVEASQLVEGSETKAEQSLNEESLNKGMMAAAESIIQNVGLKEDTSDDTMGSLPNRSSSAYVDGDEKLRAEHLDSQGDKLKYVSDVMTKADIKNEFSSGREILARERITSLDSEAFHSVHSWIEPENDGYSRSFSKDSVFYKGPFKSQNDILLTKFRYVKSNQIEVLRLVDELRDQLTGLFDQTAKAKLRSHIGNTQQEVQQPLRNSYNSKLQANQCYNSNLPNRSAGIYPYNKACACCVCLHYHHGLCRACSSSVCCHLSKDPCPCCHKAQTFDHGLEKLPKEDKRKPAKRHCRPVSGGAPFVICSKCLRLLQLPADVLVSPKLLHKLQCGACLEVLTFSFRARPPKIPQTPTETQHPPSEVSASRSNGRPQGDPVSFTEDGPSFDTSSTEAKARRKRNGKQVADLSLHRLMGYSSASELIYQPVDDVDSDDCEF